MSTSDNEDTDELELRAWVSKLFAPDPEDDETAEPDEQQKPPGYVAKEGNNPNTGPDPDADLRAFAKQLFDNQNPY